MNGKVPNKVGKDNGRNQSNLFGSLLRIKDRTQVEYPKTGNLEVGKKWLEI